MASELHAAAIAAYSKTSGNLPPISGYIVGVLHHSIGTKSEYDPKDFVVYKCNKKHSIHHVRYQYLRENPVSHVILTFDGSPLNNETPLHALAHSPDRIIILNAFLPKDIAVSGNGLVTSGATNLDAANHRKGKPPTDRILAPTRMDTWGEFDTFPRIPEKYQQAANSHPRGRDWASLKQAHLGQLLNEKSVDALESGKVQAIKLVHVLQKLLGKDASGVQNISGLGTDIEALSEQSGMQETIIGLFGRTGAGKSSLINALLGMERLVPTSCWKACTSVPTKFRYNSSNDLESLFQATWNYITFDDWVQELKIFARDLEANGNDDEGLDSECASMAWLAFDKLKAVYPHLSEEDFRPETLESLAYDPSVKRVLGTTKHVCGASRKAFASKIEAYIAGHDDEGMQHWPLIQDLEILVKAPVLSTGAVLVDLPGVEDSNAARSKVADKYLQLCTSIWIIADVTRPADDNSAASLLQQAFKKQLKLDCHDSIAFICTKSDQLPDDEEAMKISKTVRKKIASFLKEAEDIREEIEDWKAQKIRAKDTLQTFQALQNERDTWEDLQEKVRRGRVVHAPEDRKRKRLPAPPTSRKTRTDRRKGDNISHDSSYQRQPLTEDEICAKLNGIKSTIKSTRQEAEDARDTIADLDDQIEEGDLRLEDIEVEKEQVKILGRNRQLKKEVQEAMASNFRDINHKLTRTNSDQGCFGSNENKDVFPVFCVSSRAFLKGDVYFKGIQGSDDLSLTEIPQLQQYCQQLTEARRVFTARAYLVKLSQVLNSLAVWVRNDGDDLSQSQKTSTVQFLQDQLIDLHQKLEHAAEQFDDNLKQSFAHEIFDKSAKAVSNAVEQTSRTLESWRNIHANTFRAICRREGKYQNKQAIYHFNERLIEPLLERITPGWQRVFGYLIHPLLDQYRTTCTQYLNNFHSRVVQHAWATGVDSRTIEILDHQVSILKDRFYIPIEGVNVELRFGQRGANRLFEETVAQKMEPVYRECIAESGRGGPGVVNRMRGILDSGITKMKFDMFSGSVEAVRESLNRSCEKLNKYLGNEAHEAYQAMRRDYMKAIGRLETTGAHPRDILRLQNAVAEVLTTADGYFATCVEDRSESVSADES